MDRLDSYKRAGYSDPIPDVNRDLVSLFLSLQFLRTADTRDVLSRLGSSLGESILDRPQRRLLHVEALWDDKLVADFSDRIRSSIWMFGRNGTDTPFVTSDNPVAFRTADNAQWLKVGMLGGGTYVVYPLAPDSIMYCYPREDPWLKLTTFDTCVSPVTFTPAMVHSENSGQVFMASRFVISQTDDFSDAREFARTIGTDVYAKHWRAEDQPDA